MIDLTSPLVVGVLAAIPCVVLLVLTVRGRLALDDPYCAGCGHSLRGPTEMPDRCAECGASFKRIGGVKFARHVRSAPWISMAAVLLVVVPGLGAGGAAWWRSRQPPVSTRGQAAAARARPAPVPVAPPPTSEGMPGATIAELVALIAAASDSSLVPAGVWNELDERVRTGRLERSDAADLLNALTALLARVNKDDRPDSTIPLRRPAMALARSGRIPESTMAPVLNMFVPPFDFVQMKRQRDDARGWITWTALGWLPSGRVDPDSDGSLGPFVARRLVGLRLNGEPAPITFNDDGDRLLLPELAPGEHELQLDFETVAFTGRIDVVKALDAARSAPPPRGQPRYAVSVIDAGNPGSILAPFFPASMAEWDRDTSWQRLASATETHRLQLSVRGADQALVDPLEPERSAVQAKTLASGARIAHAVVRPVGGPGEQTLQVRVLWSGRSSVQMVARLVVKLGDRVVASAPKVLNLRPVHHPPDGKPVQEQMLFEIDQTIAELPRDVGRIQVTIEPVDTIPGAATPFERGLRVPVELAPVDLRRSDLGE